MFSMASEYLYTSCGVTVEMKLLFISYSVMSISFIQCAEKLFTGRRFGSMSWAALDLRVFLDLGFLGFFAQI